MEKKCEQTRVIGYWLVPRKRMQSFTQTNQEYSEEKEIEKKDKVLSSDEYPRVSVIRKALEIIQL